MHGRRVIFGLMLASIEVGIALPGCRCGDEPAAPRVVEQPTVATPETPPEAPAPTPTASPTPPPAAELETPQARWRPMLAFDASGRDLAIASYALQTEPTLARASSFSLRFCHGDDPVGMVLSLGLSATIDRDVAGTRRSLRCGALVASHAPEGSRIHVIELDRETQSGHVLAIATTLTGLTEMAASLPTAHGEMLADTRILCASFDPGSCAERNDSLDFAIAVVDGHLLAGSYPQLARVLTWDARPRLAALLRELVVRFAAQPDVEVDFLAAGGLWTIGPRRWLPLTVGDASDALAEAVRADARAVAWEHGMREGAVLIDARCADTSTCPGAEAIEHALAGYHASWRTTASQRVEELFEGVDDRACERASETERMTAISEATVTREANVSLLTYRASTPVDAACESASTRALEGAAARVHDVIGEL